ncbi:MAG: dihydrofolate reductase [Verrucomicrobiota bacterium]
MKKSFKAIAAMSLNRVIGAQNKLPWHLPEELRWFKKMTTGNVIIMGRKTWESIGKPLPNRETIVISRMPVEIPGARTIRSLSELQPENDPREYFIIGGAQIFELGLPLCSDLYLTIVKREVEGDVFFPAFESHFRQKEVVMDTPEFSIVHYERAGQ